MMSYHEDFSRVLKNTGLSRQMGTSIVSLGCLFNKKDYYCRDRTRDDYMLLTTIAGQAWVKEGKRKKALGRNTWFLLRPGMVHSYRDENNWSFAYVHFHGTLVDRLIGGMSFMKRENLAFRQVGVAARELLMKLIDRAADASTAGEITRNAILLELLACLHTDYCTGRNNEEPIFAAREYILNHLDRELELPQLAQNAGMSQFHFSRLFKEKYGYPPIRFLLKMRIERAKELLRTEPEERKIYEIAELCGFKNPLYFSKMFKRWTNMSPESFRKYIRNLNYGD